MGSIRLLSYLSVTLFVCMIAVTFVIDSTPFMFTNTESHATSTSYACATFCLDVYQVENWREMFRQAVVYSLDLCHWADKSLSIEWVLSEAIDLTSLGAGMAQWWEHSPPTNVARVRFPDPASYVGWVCWFSSLHREVFSGYSGFPSCSSKN